MTRHSGQRLLVKWKRQLVADDCAYAGADTDTGCKITIRLVLNQTNSELPAIKALLFTLVDILEQRKIDSSGRLLMGTTTEGEATADNLTIADSGSCGITIRSGTGNDGSIFFSDATSEVVNTTDIFNIVRAIVH